MIKLLDEFNYNNVIGDLFPIDEFIDCVDSGSFIPYDGSIADIIVDGKRTNIRVVDWNGTWYNKNTEVKPHMTSLKNISKIEGKVEVNWCNK